MWGRLNPGQRHFFLAGVVECFDCRTISGQELTSPRILIRRVGGLRALGILWLTAAHTLAWNPQKCRIPRHQVRRDSVRLVDAA